MLRVITGKQSFLVICLAAILFLPTRVYSSHGNLDLPALSDPDQYGDVFIDRVSSGNKVMPVVFSHWVHRTKYTCRVCHVELNFSMKASDTGLACGKGEMTGKFCTVCHDNKIAFGTKGPEGEQNCERCHNANASPNRRKFAELKSKMPSALFGNEIDWAKALADGTIKPKNSLSNDFQPVILDRTLKLEAEMGGIPPAVFPHKIHTEWLDCEMCHPDIFNIKKKTTKHFSMWRILRNEFCGVCHLRIAFPMNDCKRCHPAMKR